MRPVAWGPVVAAVLVACAQVAPETPAPDTAPSLLLTLQASGTDVLLQAVSPVDASTVWVSGHGGTWAVTEDGGATWVTSVMQGEEGLQFRDVHAFDPRTAYLLSSGEGELSRIYRTDDGGISWSLQYRARNPDAFLDCMSFWDPDRGLVFGDEVDGSPFILRTQDGGATWTRVPAEVLPPAQEGEGGFAASGTCLVTAPGGSAWISTGNADVARVLRTIDWGLTWAAVETPIVAGSGAGHTTIQIRDRGLGIVLGGIIGQDSLHTDNVAVTADGGATWTLAGRPEMPGPVYGSALTEIGGRDVVVAVGPRGLSWSADLGATWAWADTDTYWAAAFASPEAGWAVGPQGRIVRMGLARR